MLPDITFRLGGDEFAVLVQYPEALTALDARAGKIFAALETPADCDGHAVVPAATIGGAVLAAPNAAADVYQARQSVVQGKSVSVRVDLGGRRIIQQNTKYDHTYNTNKEPSS